VIDDGFDSRAQCDCHSHSGFSRSDFGADQLHPPFTSLRHAALEEFLFEPDASDVSFFILLSGAVELAASA
jgi:hypothetical protein